MSETLIGKEVSLPITGSRKRARGYIAEHLPEEDQVVVRLYPGAGDTHEEVTISASIPRLLSSPPPKDWEAVDIQTDEGEPWISLRFRPWVMDALRERAAREEKSIDQIFNELLEVQLDKTFSS
jgi:hypothetical protein